MRIQLTEARSRAFIAQLFEALGAAKEDAAVVADHLTRAEMRGLASHGLQRIPAYVRRVRAGGYNVRPDIRVVRETPSTALMDADGALGMVSGCRAMRLAMEKARVTGTATVSVGNANHIGFLAYYTMMAAEAGMIGMAVCNAGSDVAVWGTDRAVLGTNPLSVAIPALRHAPVVFDAATSVVAQGKVAVAAIEGKPIPGHWAYDTEGRPTTDAREALRGTMRPFGEYKGSGLSMLISLMTAGLSGMAFDMEPETLRRRGDDAESSALADLFTVIDIAALTDAEVFRGRVDQFIDSVKGTPAAPGFDEILVPGEKEWRADQAAQEQGFTISEALFDSLRQVAREAGLTDNFEGWTTIA